MNWIRRERGRETYINLMAQYHPAGRVSGSEYPDINRTVSPCELEQGVNAFRFGGIVSARSRDELRSNGLRV